MISTPVLVLPGLSSSGSDHWQTIWQSLHPEWIRVEQKDWFNPCLSSWIQSIDSYVKRCAEPPVLIAHSLACIAIAHWAALSPRPVQAAFLVAPADVESPNPHMHLIREFAPVPRQHLPFPCKVIASSNDPYGELGRVRRFAADWGADCVVAGDLGHINAQSPIGEWVQGQELLADFLSTLDVPFHTPQKG